MGAGAFSAGGRQRRQAARAFAAESAPIAENHYSFRQFLLGPSLIGM
jgi:hypothetical protein